MNKKKKTNTGKYKNRKVKIDNHIFPSIGEGARYLQLKDYEKHGVIEGLDIQVEYVIIPAVKKKSKGTNRAVKYIADFRYVKNGEIIVEDFKGRETDVFRIKEKLMLWVWGIEILKTTDKDLLKRYIEEAKRHLV